MGGVDKLDSVCSLYKNNLISKGWYMYSFNHFLHIVLADCWLLYRRDIVLLAPDVQPVIFRKFILSVANSLVYLNKPISPLPLVPIKRQRISSSQESRHDKVDHFATYSERQERCKLCQKITFVECMKWRQHLCFVRERNRFLLYHTP